MLSWQPLYNKQVEVLFPIEETIVRSIITYSKLRPSLSKETVSLKIGQNIEMLVCFICVGSQDRILIDIIIIYYLFFIFS